MHCISCGTELPLEAAHCPECGVVTLYNVSASGVSPDDLTAISSPSADAQTQSATDYGSPPYGLLQQNPYDPYNPYDVPRKAPPPPHRQVSKRLLIAIAVALILVGGSTLIWFLHGGKTPPSATASASPTLSQSNPPATFSSQGTSSYPISRPLNISASCQGQNVPSITGKVVNLILYNSFEVTLEIRYINNSSKEYQHLTFNNMALTNNQENSVPTPYPFPPLLPNDSVQLSFSFPGLNTTSGTQYRLTWDISSTDQNDSWTCTFPPATITL